jgi:hypothetical protein
MGAPVWDLPAARVLTRTTDDGTALEVRANRYPTDWGWGQRVPFATPPAWCFPSGAVYVGVRTDGAVGQGRTVRYDEIRPGTLNVAGAVVGGAEGEPRWLVVVQVPATTTRVRATFPAGGSDTMAPVDGLAVLTAPVAASVDRRDMVAVTSLPDLRVVATGPDGEDAITYAGPWQGTGGASSELLGGPRVPPPPPPGADDPSCLAPTALPAPGPTQPSDPAGATAAVRGSWDQVFNLDQPDAVALDHVDDPEGVDVALQRVRTGGLPPETLAQVEVTIEELVFADPDTAYVRYRVDAAAPLLDDQFGELRLIDGTWKVTRATVCTLLAAGGGPCPPQDG